MTLTNEPAIERLVHRLLDRSLPKAEWTHEADFAAALWLLRHKSPHATPTGMRAVISAYNEASGNPNLDSSGYHHTITVASMRAAANALAGKDHLPVSLVLASLMGSRFGKPGWLLEHWRREVLFSVSARLGWVEPDIAPLPF